MPARRPRTAESAFNQVLVEQLRKRHPRWSETNTEFDWVAAEQTGVFDGDHSRLRPDIVVRHPGALPVIVETEFEPARNVESEAKDRLGKTINGMKVEGALAVRAPRHLSGLQTNLAEAVTRAQFEFCLLTERGLLVERWPQEGWLSGGLDRLAELIEHASLSETRLTEAADVLESGISNSAAFLRNHRTTRPDMFTQMSQVLHQEDGLQTTRMAVAIVVNAFVFQNAIASNHDIPAPDGLRGDNGLILKEDVRHCWEHILRINYWPIFSLALELIEAVPPSIIGPFLDSLVKLSDQLAGLGAISLQDLSGQMFQRLISDRKFLATFYTLPSSAALLAELATRRLPTDWTDANAIRGLQIADLACGTGSLLSAARQTVARHHRRAGGDDRELHAKMMEEVLVAADIMPASTHLTASTLSSAHPSERFDSTRIFIMAYGEDQGEVQIGSLDLTINDQAMSIFGANNAAKVGGSGTEYGQYAVVEGDSCDLVIMNPPFTNPTNHEATDAPVPSFAGFGTSEAEQSAMSERLKEIRRTLAGRSQQTDNGHQVHPYPAGNGNAGLASNFIDLAHAKLQDGGCLALVLPAAFAQGKAWENARRLLYDYYEDIALVGIAATGSTARAFSADTGMAELLVVARKSEARQVKTRSVFVVSLRRRPYTALEGSLVAEAIDEAWRSERSVGSIYLGNQIPLVGSFIRAAPEVAGSALGIKEMGLAESMATLYSSGNLRLPQSHHSVGMPVVRLAELGKRGAVDRDINGALPRGPFDIFPLQPGDYPEYPVLWSHDAGRESTLFVSPDSQGLIRHGCEERATRLWQRTASRLHMNRDFRLNSQPLAACLTERTSLGGTAWPNFVLQDSTWEQAILLWANTSLGLMSFWWHGTRQQQGRSRITISRLPGLITLDVRCFDNQQLERCGEIVEALQDQEFLPANEAWRDPVRQELDRMMFADILNCNCAVLKGLATLRDQWCHEPSVHGGKQTRPPEEEA